MTTTQIIELEGEVARYIERTIIQETTIDTLKKQLTTQIATIFPLLPTHSTRYAGFDPNQNKGLFLVEVPPDRHHLRIWHSGDEDRFMDDAERSDNEGIGVFNVQLPYSYFTFPVNLFISNEDRLVDFSIERVGLLWSPKPIREPSNPLWYAKMPNIDDGGGICWGDTVTTQPTLSESIDAMINGFFSSVFNEDLGHMTPFGTSMTEWEENSDEPLGYMTWDMWNQGPPFTLEDLWEQYMGATNLFPIPNMANLSNNNINIPELPATLTILRAKEWFEGLTDRQQARIRAGIELVGNE